MLYIIAAIISVFLKKIIFYFTNDKTKADNTLSEYSC